MAAMVVIDAVARLLPGVLGGDESAAKDSFADGLLEHAHYTRPDDYNGNRVPDVLLSGDHKAIERWRLESSLIRTLLKRKDMLADRKLQSDEREILKQWGRDIEALVRS